MSVGVTERGQWYYLCARCRKALVVMDNKEQAEAADALHALSHRDDDNAK